MVIIDDDTPGKVFPEEGQRKYRFHQRANYISVPFTNATAVEHG